MSPVNGVIYILNLLLLFVMIAANLTLPITSWWLDNLLSLQIQWAFLTLIVLLINIIRGHKWLIFLSLLSVSAMAYQPLVRYFTSLKQPATQQILKIGQLNLRYQNPHIEQLLRSLSTADYDILALQEVGDNWQQKIQVLKKTYPYSIGSSDCDASPSGLVFFSRWPIVERKIHDLGYKGGHIIEALIQSPNANHPVQIFTLHPTSPRNARLWRLRNATLHYVAQLARHSLFHYKIILGDLNSTPWSTQFKNLQHESLLNNSSNLFSYIPSWSYNNSNPVIRLLSSAYLDHCLISAPFSVLSKQQKNISGSDHRLIYTELGMPY